VSAQQIFLSPYRCRDCRERFWVIGRNTYFFAGVVGIAMLSGAVVWSMLHLVDRVGPAAAATAQVTAPSPELVRLAENNDATAQYDLARAHASGHAVTKNEKEAWKWLERSARQGNTQAQYELAIVLREGRGTLQDWEGARHWMVTAAEGGHPQAQFDLAVMYRNGAGITADNVKAYIWFNLAAAQGVPGAAPLRDAQLNRLSATEIAEAQKEARRMSERDENRSVSAR
jgi:TPR repeat protein